MGLDTFAIVGRDTLYDAVEKNENGNMVIKTKLFKDVEGLCGGMLSGNGNGGSFRGKVYDSFVQSVTGESLYQDDIDPDTCKMMSNKLVEYAENMEKEGTDKAKSEYGETDRSEVDALAEFFNVCAENGYHVTGWW